MPGRPDYEGLRERAGFRWHVSSSYDAFYGLTDVPIEEVNLKPEAMVELVRQGRPRFREMWGEGVPMPGLCTPAISYGHLNGLGAELIFPKGGEVSFEVICGSLGEAIELLREPVDFASAGMAPFYLDYKRTLEEALPGEAVRFAYSAQGPMTTAYGLRGMGIFTDVYDESGRMGEFLDLVTKSVIRFRHFMAEVNGDPRVDPTRHTIFDDVGSMFSVDMWRAFVLPAYESFFRGMTTGGRGAHIEDLRPEQLPLLEEMGLDDFDAGISHKINPKTLSTGCRVPFRWRMGGFHYYDLTEDLVEDWVCQAVADNASCVFTVVMADMCDRETPGKVRALMRAAEDARTMLASGASRRDVGERVSPEGKARFWDRWPE